MLCLAEFASAACCSPVICYDKLGAGQDETVRNACDAKACVENRSQFRGSVAFAIANV